MFERLLAVGDSVGLELVRPAEKPVGGGQLAEKFVLEFVELQEAVFGGPVFFGGAVGEDVEDFSCWGDLCQLVADEDHSVAVERIGLGAHEGHAEVFHALEEPFEPLPEGGQLGDEGVFCLAFDVAAIFGAAGVPFAIFPMLMYHSTQLVVDTLIAQRLSKMQSNVSS